MGSGPSPRGRGNLVHGLERRVGLRTIPAWAGEPRCAEPRRGSRWDHPRVGGGTGIATTLAVFGGGPSPRGRGNRDALSLAGVHGGTIPAWAGEPVSPPRSRSLAGDHPRVGGGTNALTSLLALVNGPSPRGRGNPLELRDALQDLGTIPAWAGEPARAPRCPSGPGDHPRVGGGTMDFTISASCWNGPSPRGRGNPTISRRRR